MTRADRAKMETRVDRYLQDADWNHIRIDVLDTVAREVDRAVRAERKAWRGSEELRTASLRRVDEKMIDGMKRVGRKT